MFIRQKFRVKNGQRDAYWALVETDPTAKGPRQRVVAWLDKLDEGGGLGIKPNLNPSRQTLDGREAYVFVVISFAGARKRKREFWLRGGGEKFDDAALEGRVFDQLLELGSTGFQTHCVGIQCRQVLQQILIAMPGKPHAVRRVASFYFAHLKQMPTARARN